MQPPPPAPPGAVRPWVAPAVHAGRTGAWDRGRGQGGGGGLAGAVPRDVVPTSAGAHEVMREQSRTRFPSDGLPAPALRGGQSPEGIPHEHQSPTLHRAAHARCTPGGHRRRRRGPQPGMGERAGNGGRRLHRPIRHGPGPEELAMPRNSKPSRLELALIAEVDRHGHERRAAGAVAPASVAAQNHRVARRGRHCAAGGRAHRRPSRPTVRAGPPRHQLARVGYRGTHRHPADRRTPARCCGLRAVVAGSTHSASYVR